MLKEFEAYIFENNLIQKNEKVLLAVSGGIDSVCMVHLLKESGISFSVAHCNFQLRGEGSEKDEQFVKELAEECEVKFHTIKFETIQVAEAEKISIQMAARNIRYKWFSEVMEEFGYAKLATAHHLNDSLETVLFNLTKGTGVSGLRGIKKQSDRVVRPLLFATKNQITEYVLYKGLSWREDVSNSSEKYHRNFIRKKVVPLLSEINPSFEVRFHETMDRISLAESALQKYLEEIRDQFVFKNKDYTEIFFDGYQKNYVLLYELVKEFGFSLRQCKEVIAASNVSGSEFISKQFWLVKDRRSLVITKLERNFNEALISENQKELIVDNDKLNFKKMDLPFKLEKGKRVALLDLKKLEFPLLVRNWNNGEKFTPLGMDQEKKISDFMIDNKIPFNLKKRYKVLVSGGEIVWLIGLRVSNQFKVTESTKNIYRIEMNQENV